MPEMRVLLLNPPAYKNIRYVREGRCEQRLSSFQYNMVPISLPSTAAVLREAGHAVLIFDAIGLNLDTNRVVQEARAFSPGLVLINVATPTFAGDAATAAAIKEALPGVFVVAFGVHVTALPEESLERARFDGVIRREPEATARDLAGALSSGKPLSEVPGLSFRANWREKGSPKPIIHNPDRPFFEDLDSLPAPALDLVDHRLYPAPLSGLPHTLIITSRGCPFGCTFCTAHLFYGSKLRLRSPVRVVDELEAVHRDQGVGLFTFWSDTFTLNRDHVVAICREILERKLAVEWMCNSRVDRVDPELLRRMAEAGCSIISFGVESGDQTILDNVRKGITTSQIISAFDAVRAAGIRSAAHVILGLPGETPDTIRTTMRLVKRIHPDYVQYYGAIPFPGTEFFRLVKESGWLTTESWEDFEINGNIVSTPLLSADALGRWRRRAYYSFYLRPRFLVEKLREVRSPREFIRLSAAGWDFLRGWIRFR